MRCILNRLADRVLHGLFWLIAAASMLVFAIDASATPVTWAISGGTMSDGGTFSGSFVYDADAVGEKYSAINIVSAGGGVGGATYTYRSPGLASANNRLLAATQAAGDFTGTRYIYLTFMAALTNNGGAITLTGGNEGLCNAACSAPATQQRSVTGGTLSAQFTVTFNNNSGTGAMAAQLANVATALTTNTFTRAGYTFSGWNTAANGSGTAYADGASYPFTANGTLFAQWTLVPVVVPVKPIPTVISPPTLAGFGNNTIVPLNLSSGDGPAMTVCLLNTLRGVIGSGAAFLGQLADGSVRVGQSGQVISFYALDASTSTIFGLSGGAGIYLQSSNPLYAVTSCGTFVATPAVYNLTELGVLLSGMGLSVQISAQCVMTASLGGTSYVVRPDYLVTQGTPGLPRLITGSDGLLRFIDSAGNTQILYPAFLDAAALTFQIAQTIGGSTTIQTDGTALLTRFDGQKFVLTPDLTLGDVPPGVGAAGWWQEGPSRYRYRIATFPPASQGFTVRPL